MSRNRIYSSAAERQKAYRERCRGSPEESVRPQRKPRAPSRPKRFAVVLEELQKLQGEYEDWRDRLPASLEGSEQYEGLTEAIDLLAQAVEILEVIQLPLGFGRN